MGVQQSDLVTVFETDDSATLAVAQSVLTGEGIRFFVQNQYLQDIMGEGRIGPNLLAGPMRIQVSTKDAEAAYEALKDLQTETAAPAVSSRYSNMRRWTARAILLLSVIEVIWLCISSLRR
ncbi:MAG TPA: DUF2007 domain-containing protein [Armatimonadota bacterium]|jgi:hypothetical protein